MRTSGTGTEADITGRMRAVMDGGYSEAEREAGALLESLDELISLLDEVPLEGLLEPRCAGE
jgi:hypothetical protein